MILRSVSIASALLLLTAEGVRAQTPPPNAPPAPEAQDTAAVSVPAAPPAPVAVAPAPADMAGYVPPALATFKQEPTKGNTLKVGFLLQPQFQALQDHALNGYASNLYVRRARVLVGGTLFGSFDYFMDTDYPNLFLATNEAGTAMAAATTTKGTPGMNIQDAFITWHPFGDVFKVDAGYMLPPLAHNAVQGAGTLYSWDYFGFSFLSSESFGSSGNPVGRDAGLQLRGLVLDGHLEYRAGLFQGLRDTDSGTDVGSRNFFRAAGRIQVNVFDPEPGYFYAGTYLGAKKILSIGVSGDTQSSYHYVAGDVFADLPAGPGVFTGQVNFAYWNGNSFIASLHKEYAVMSEVGYNIVGVRVNPIVRFEHLWVSEANVNGVKPNQTRAGGGLAFWPYGHSVNVKAFYTRNTEDGTAHAANQFNVQWQLYFF